MPCHTSGASTCLQVPLGYTIIKEDTTLMHGECFFVPGTNQKTWNNVTPATRILVRNDCLHQVCGPKELALTETFLIRHPRARSSLYACGSLTRSILRAGTF